MLGCAGNDEVRTPNLDNLASKGIRFSGAFCPNAMCSPCRASVLTGLMPSQHGIHTWLDDRVIGTWPEKWNAIGEFKTLAERLVEEGYDTALIGKYHLGIADEPQNGFREWVTFQIGHVLSFYDNAMIDNGKRFMHSGHSVEHFTQRAIDYIESRGNATEPFFLFLTYPAHTGIGLQSRANRSTSLPSCIGARRSSPCCARGLASAWLIGCWSGTIKCLEKARIMSRT